MRGAISALCLGLLLVPAPGTSAQCGPGSGDCCAAHATPGCSDLRCCAAVCATDPFCCGYVWDALCADQAALLCDGCPAGEPPGNDCCETALPLKLGQGLEEIPFTTIDATTDGPPHPDCSSGPCAGDFQVHNDVWFHYTADFDGLLALGTCGRVGFDSKIALYEGCDCPRLDASLIGCTADGPDCEGPGAAMIIPVGAGTCYTIRVGSVSGETGRGALVVGPVSVGGCPGLGSCQGSGGNGTPGCEDEVCCQKVCAIDPFCCDVVWDGICADEANFLCPTGDCFCDLHTVGDCCIAHVMPFCEHPGCCNAVCGFDASCCEVAWDEACADLARHFCPEFCPPLPTGDPDLDGDGTVGILDFLALLAAWGPCTLLPQTCPGDLDGDQAVGVVDLLLLLAGWS